MSEFVNRFKVKESDLDGIVDIQEYLNPNESVKFTYIDGWYIGEFSDNVFIKYDTFKKDFPNIMVLSRKK